MIRPAAAMALARYILAPLTDHTELMVELLATLIMRRVEADELEQKLEALEPKEAA